MPLRPGGPLADAPPARRDRGEARTEGHTLTYAGDELELFASATRWKGYYGGIVAPYLRGDVLEVGAGIGGTARVLCDGRQRSWAALEPDPALADAMRRSLAAAPLPAPTRVVTGTLASLPPESRFDAVLYVDVLEHIEDDRGEVARAAERLVAGGALIALAPAQQWLYSPFDERIGHYRRYDRRSIAALTPPALALERVLMLDAVGMLASAANRFVLRQDAPTARQVGFWNRWLVPSSRLVDPLVGHRFGRSVLAIWRRRAADAHS
jgi:SAM-dependent methyltransferase